MAEGRGKAQAATLRKTRSETVGPGPPPRRRASRRSPRRRCRSATSASSTAGEVIPGDGDVVEGIATVDESAITGESAPVIRESGGDRSAVTGGTRVLSDEIVVRITAKPGETFLDRMIALVEGADRQKTPNEIALSILLAGLHDHLPARRRHAAAVRHLLRRRAADHRARRPARVPDPDDDRRPAVGDRHRRHGPARAAQRAGHVAAGPSRPPATSTTLLLDKTGHDHVRRPPGRRAARPCTASPSVELAEAALASSLADETPEGRSIVEFAASRYGLDATADRDAVMVPFTAQTRMSGMDFPAPTPCRRGRSARGPPRACAGCVADAGGDVPLELGPLVDAVVQRRRHPARRHRPARRAGRRASSA